MLRNQTITGLRGLLALSVVLFHIYNGAVEDHILSEDYYPLLQKLGPLSVDIFFVISGYLIISTLKRHQNMKKFIMDRAIRIYPVFLVIHVLIFIVGPVIRYSWFADITLSEYVLNFFSNLFFLPGIFNLPIAQIVAWSLSFEAAFYVLVSLVFISYVRRNKVLLFMVSCMSIYLMIRFPIVLFFGVGILLSLSNIVKVLGKYFPKNDFLGLVLIILSFVIYSPDFIYPALIAVFLFFITIVTQNGLLSRLLQRPAMQYLGGISYSLYLWHTVLLMPIKRVILHFKLDQWLGFGFWFFISLAGSLIISHFSFIYLEVKLAHHLKAKTQNAYSYNAEQSQPNSARS